MCMWSQIEPRKKEYDPVRIFFLQKSDMTLKLLKKKITAEKFYVGTQPNQNFYIIKFILNANIILQCLFTFTENILRQTKTTKIT